MNYEDLEILKNSNTVCLIGHVEPDPDALSSMMVFKQFLKKHFDIPTVDLYAENESLSEGMKAILDKENLIQSLPDVLKSYDTAIMMDSPSSDRLGIFKKLFETTKSKIVIDHHATNLYEGNINIVEICSSTCEIVYSILKKFEYKLTPSEKGKIYAGMITDTNNFAVGEVKQRTFEICSEICEEINKDEIYRVFLSSNTIKKMYLLSLVINNIKSYDENQIIISHLNNEMLNEIQANHNDFCGVVNTLATINTANLVCFIEPKGYQYYVSMRARNGFDVSHIAKNYGGGGHVGAAAFTSNLTIEEIENLILAEFKKELKTHTVKNKNLFK